MIQFQNNIPLAPLTTFKIGGPAKTQVEISDPNEISEAIEYAKKNSLKTLVLGGGSNMLISDNGFDGLVILMKILGIKIISSDQDTVLVQAYSGEIWDDVVSFAVKQNLWGIENLSHIPGKTGALAVQNVGAYSQEASRVIESVEVFDSSTNAIRTFKNDECRFSYRHSIFNSEQKGRYVIISITLSLCKTPQPNVGYVDLKNFFSERKIDNPTLPQIREAITSIRDKKYPFPISSVGGNAGSFFKNVVLNQEEYAALEENIAHNFSPEILNKLKALKDKFPQESGIKIPSAFLIEICELKGKLIGGAKINENQPLVILNSGIATANDVLTLFKTVRQTVYSKTGVILTIEPELVGFTKVELDSFFVL